MSRNAPVQPERLTPRQRRAVALLLAGKTRKATAAAVGVHRRTLARWAALPAFAEAIRAGMVAEAEATAPLASALARAALRTAFEAVSAGNVGAALRVLALPRLAGSEPAEVEADQAEARRIRIARERREAVAAFKVALRDAEVEPDPRSADAEATA